jgi:hypothetical protein
METAEAGMSYEMRRTSLRRGRSLNYCVTNSIAAGRSIQGTSKSRRICLSNLVRNALADANGWRCARRSKSAVGDDSFGDTPDIKLSASEVRNGLSDYFL